MHFNHLTRRLLLPEFSGKNSTWANSFNGVWLSVRAHRKNFHGEECTIIPALAIKWYRVVVFCIFVSVLDIYMLWFYVINFFTSNKNLSLLSHFTGLTEEVLNNITYEHINICEKIHSDEILQCCVAKLLLPILSYFSDRLVLI